MAIPTSSEISQQYLTTVKALNPDTSPDIIGTDWWLKAQVIGGVVAGLYADQYNYSLSIFPQNAAGTLVDRHLATWGLPPRFGAFPSRGIVSNTTNPASPTDIPAGTLLNYGNSGISYLTLEDATVPVTGSVSINIQCTTNGPGTQLPPGITLTPNTTIPGVSSFTVSSMVDGSNAESDAQAISRILQRIQTPAAGGTVGDYYRWAIFNTTVTGITDALVVPNFTSQTIVGVFILAGGFDIDSILANPSVPLDRTASASQIETVSNYIETQRPCTDSYFVSSVDTYMIPTGVINVQVRLVSGLDLTDIIAGTGLTAQELIKREVRRAVLQTPIGGNVVDGTPYLFASDVEQTLDNSLSATAGESGLYASLLVDRQITLLGGSPNYPLPNAILPDGNLPYVYDVAYADINVSTL